MLAWYRVFAIRVLVENEHADPASTPSNLD